MNRSCCRSKECVWLAESEIAASIRGLNEALERKDADSILSLYSDDATLEVSEGTFAGKEEIGRYWRWQFGQASEITSTEVEMIVQGDKLCAVHMIGVTMSNGMKWTAPVTCIYSFADRKIQSHRMCFDRLLVAKQAAKGWLAGKLVGSVVSKMEKGLH